MLVFAGQLLFIWMIIGFVKQSEGANSTNSSSAATASKVCSKDGRKFGWMCRYDCFCEKGANCDKQTGECQTCASEDGVPRWGPGCMLSSFRYYDKKTKGHYYQGFMSKFVKNGKSYECQKWDSNDPNDNWYIDAHLSFPELQTNLAKSYCRNPNYKYRSAPWCYNSKGYRPRDGNCNVTYASCPQYRYSIYDTIGVLRSCQQECHCNNPNEDCGRTKGVCQSGCHSDWTGKYCHICKDERSWGPFCQKKCRCNENALCDPTTGRCPRGCHPNYTGDDCQTVLPMLKKEPWITYRDNRHLHLAWEEFDNKSHGGGTLSHYLVQYHPSASSDRAFDADLFPEFSRKIDKNRISLSNENHIQPNGMYDIRVSVVIKESRTYRGGPVLRRVQTCGAVPKAPHIVNITLGTNGNTYASVGVVWKLIKDPKKNRSVNGSTDTV